MVSKAVRGSPPLACIDSLRGRRELGYLLQEAVSASFYVTASLCHTWSMRQRDRDAVVVGRGARWLSQEMAPQRIYQCNQACPRAQESKFADQGRREALIRGQFRKAWNSKGRTDPFPPGLPWPSETLPGCCAESPFRDRHLKKPRFSGTNSASVCLSSSCLLKGLL